MKYLAESLWVALGAAIGANARYWIGYWAKAQVQTFPWPTLVINLVGSFLLGAFSAAALSLGWGWQSRLFFAVGLCGGFTTFSTFSFEVIELMEQRSWKLVSAYALGSVVLCVAGCLMGVHVGRALFGHAAVATSPNQEP